MPRGQNVKSKLSQLIERLRTERAQHQAAIEEIDRTFAQFGIAAGGGRGRRGRRAGSGAAPAGRRRRTRGSFPVTAEQDVLDFVKKAGKPTTAEINAFWTKRGRGGKADNTITKLVKQKKLKREKIKGERGSRYAIA